MACCFDKRHNIMIVDEQLVRGKNLVGLLAVMSTHTLGVRTHNHMYSTCQDTQPHVLYVSGHTTQCCHNIATNTRSH